MEISTITSSHKAEITRAKSRPSSCRTPTTFIILPALLHEAVSAEYLRPKEKTNMTLYQWLQTQPYDIQREEGLKILRNLHILK